MMIRRWKGIKTKGVMDVEGWIVGKQAARWRSEQQLGSCVLAHEAFSPLPTILENFALPKSRFRCYDLHRSHHTYAVCSG